MFIIVCIAGSVVQGSVQFSSTVLTASVNSTDTTITVGDTTGFSAPGVIVIDDERIAYSHLTTTTFSGKLAQPIVRGADSTTAVSHNLGATVRTVEGLMLNTSMTYNIAVMADASGTWAAVTFALALLRIIGSFLVLPIGFLGTDLMIVGVLWYAMAAGMLISMAMALAGMRRV